MPTGPLEIDVRVSNTNGRSVIAEVTLRRYVGADGQTSTNDEWTKEQTIGTGFTTFTFSNLPGGIYEAFAKYRPTPEDEATMNPSGTVQIFTSLDSLPVESLTYTVLGAAGSYTLDAVWSGSDQNQDGISTRDVQLNLGYSWFTSNANFPVNFLGTNQHRITYKLVSGQNTNQITDTMLEVGQQEPARILLQPFGNTGSFDLRGFRLRLEPWTAPTPPSWIGTFSVEMELEVRNPQKNEWSAYSPRVRATLNGDFRFVIEQ